MRNIAYTSREIGPYRIAYYYGDGGTRMVEIRAGLGLSDQCIRVTRDFWDSILKETRYAEEAAGHLMEIES